MPTPRTAIAAALLLPWAVWAAVRVLGLDLGHPVVAAISLTPYVAATAVVPVLGALALRRWRVAAAGAAVAALLAALVLPRALGGERIPPGADGPALRVMSVNVYVGRADMTALLRLAVAERVDVVSLQELTPDALARFDAAGGSKRFPGRAVEPRARGAAGSGLVARWPLTDRAGDDATAAEQPDALLRRPGAAPVRIKAVHPYPPITATQQPRWEATFARFPRPARGAAPRVLIGDFNATLDHRVMRALLDDGYVDAAEATGAGLTPTWRRGRLGLAIDHVLLDDPLGVRSGAGHPLPGADQRAGVAELVLPRG